MRKTFMVKELHRAIRSKKNIAIVAFVVFVMFLNAYHDGWKTGLFASRAVDIADPADIEFYQRYFGNTYRVWKSSYSVIQVLIPLLLLIPYALSFTIEKNSMYRYLLVSREGNAKYLFHKVLAIVISGVLIVGFGEALFYGGSFLFTQHDNAGEYIAGIVGNAESFFYQDAKKYFFIVFALHLVYYAAFLLFSVGVTSFLKNRIAILLLPFLISSMFELIMPPYMQPNVLLLPWVSDTYNIYGFAAMVVLYCFMGIACLLVSEKKYCRNGA